jgi:two-component system cell cycle response regulator
MLRKVLANDDWKTIRMIVTRILKIHGCTICEAANGEEGLRVAAQEKPDLILLDITMPVMDGVTMLWKLREDPVLKDIPAVMLTAESIRNNVACFATLGVSDLRKPGVRTILVNP